MADRSADDSGDLKPGRLWRGEDEVHGNGVRTRRAGSEHEYQSARTTAASRPPRRDRRPGRAHDAAESAVTLSRENQRASALGETRAVIEICRQSHREDHIRIAVRPRRGGKLHRRDGSLRGSDDVELKTLSGHRQRRAACHLRVHRNRRCGIGGKSCAGCGYRGGSTNNCRQRQAPANQSAMYRALHRDFQSRRVSAPSQTEAGSVPAIARKLRCCGGGVYRLCARRGCEPLVPQAAQGCVGWSHATPHKTHPAPMR